MSESKRRPTSKAIALPFLGAGVGAIAALLACVVVAVADIVLEATLKVRGLSWEMGLLITPVAATLGGLPVGFLGAVVGNRWVAGVLGAIGLGTTAWWVMRLDSSLPDGSRIAWVSAGVLSGFAAGFAGGALTERFERRQAARATASEVP